MNREPADGFVCRRCGQCCRESGYVYLLEEDIDRIAAFLSMDSYAFTGRYTRLAADRKRLSLIEKSDESCVFLNADGCCAIQSVKPMQCESFPRTWRYNEMGTVCKGWNSNEKR